MVGELSQEDIDIYSADAAGEKEIPGSPYYTDGVDVGYTAPAKWWNWFWNKITTFLTNSKSDKNALLTEAKNLLSAASIAPSAAATHQLSDATDKVSYGVCVAYHDAEITEEIDGVMVTHKVNQPYVVGYTLYIPDTELL